MVKIRGLFVVVFCVVTVCAVEQKSENVRDKRTLHIVLKAFADSLGYDVQKRPPAPPNAIPKPAGGRSPVNPPLVPPMMPPPKGPTPPMMVPPMMPPPMMPAPKAPVPPMMPRPMPPAMPPPKAPAMPMPAPKAPPAPMMPPMMPPQVPAKPNAARLPTVPPLLTETIQKMFNINFNWNRNLQTPPPSTNAPKAPAPPMTQAPAPAPKAPAPAPKAPGPAPSQASAPAPKTPVPAPKAPVPAPNTPASAPKAPAAPASTTGPVKHVLYSYDYDDGQLAYPQNLKDYDNYYQYDNAEYQQPQQQQQQQQQQLEPQLEQDQEKQQPAEEEEIKQQSEETEAASKEADPQNIEDAGQQQKQSYGDVIQNYWQTSPWHNNQQENYQEESRIPQFGSKELGGHSFVVNHPGGSSYSRMEHKKVETQPNPQQKFESPIYYYEEQQQPPLETRNQQLDHQQNYHFQGPSFDQYFYVLNGQQNGGKANVEMNNNGEEGAKQPAESRQKETISPEAALPLPAHNIYQQNPYLQWISPFEASSEVQEKKVKATPNANQKQKGAQNPSGSPFAYNYEPDHYNSDFSLHTIPPPSQEDYSRYEPAPFKLEDELSNKAQIKEEQYGRKYTTVHADNLVHHTIG